MTIIEALEEVKALVPGIRKLILADMNEANATETDQLIDSELPAMLVMPFEPVDNFPNQGSGLTKTTVDLDIFFLMRSTNPTIDYSSAKIEIECVAPMRLLARKFVHQLQTHAIIDPETAGITRVQHSPVYSGLDANLFGNRLRMNVPVIENPVVC